MSNTSRIPVVFHIDVEPDEIHIDRRNPKPWAGLQFAHQYLKDFRSKFEDATGHRVHFTWGLRMDPQIALSYGSASWVADQYGSFFEEYRANGDDIGLHVHTYRWSGKRDGWIDDCGNPEWVSECLQSSVVSFMKVFGYASSTLRFGNYWVSTAAINEAESLGIRYDLTVEPGRKSLRSTDRYPQTGPTPNYFHVPRVPYAPSRSDFRQRAGSGEHRSITCLPLTSAYLDLGWGVQGLGHRLVGLGRNGIRSRLQRTPIQMMGRWTGKNTYSEMLNRALELQKRPYLAVAIRSSLNDKFFPYADSSLKALLNHKASSRFIFSTPAEALALLSPLEQKELIPESPLINAGLPLR